MKEESMMADRPVTAHPLEAVMGRLRDMQAVMAELRERVAGSRERLCGPDHELPQSKLEDDVPPKPVGIFNVLAHESAETSDALRRLGVDLNRLLDILP